jgi:hypothetical protein
LHLGRGAVVGWVGRVVIYSIPPLRFRACVRLDWRRVMSLIGTHNNDPQPVRFRNENEIIQLERGIYPVGCNRWYGSFDLWNDPRTILHRQVCLDIKFDSMHTL